MAFRRHLELCIAALTRYGKITEFDRMRTLRNWDDLKYRTDVAAFEALARRTVCPCLPPATTSRCRKERRVLARWLTARAIRSGTVLHLP